MSDRVYELYQYNVGEELTESFLQDVFEELRKQEPGLKEYAKDFRVGYASKDLGNYVLEDRLIKVSKPLIIQKCPQNPHLLGIEVIRHELEHARDLQTLEQRRKDIESLIVQIGLRYYSLRHGLDPLPNIDHLYPDFLEKEMQMYYNINPEERMAEIRGWSYMVNMLKNQRKSDDLLLARRMLRRSYVRGYEDKKLYLDSPTMQFLLKTGMFHEYYWLKNRIEQKNYCFDTRLLYGLPLTKKEYDQKILRKVRLRKKREDE